MKLYGAARLRAAIAEKRTLALEAAARLAQVPGIVMDAPPQLSLFAFHLVWPGASLAQQNEATRELMERVTLRGRVMITGCEVDGRILARVCVLSFRSRPAHIDRLVEDVSEEARALIASVPRR